MCGTLIERGPSAESSHWQELILKEGKESNFNIKDSCHEWIEVLRIMDVLVLYMESMFLSCATSWFAR